MSAWEIEGSHGTSAEPTESAWRAGYETAKAQCEPQLDDLRATITQLRELVREAIPLARLFAGAPDGERGVEWLYWLTRARKLTGDGA